MKSETTNRISLGLFVTTALVILVAMVYYIGQRQRLFGKTIRITGMCRDVSGLQVGNNVRFSGINVGTIDNIQIVTDTSVMVTMLIDGEARKFIKKDATAVIGSEGLMGSKVMNIIDGSIDDKSIENNDTIETSEAVNMDQILASVKVTADNAAGITTNLSAMITNARAGKGAIGKLFMDSAFAQNLSQTVVNAKEGIGGFKENMDAVHNNFLLKGYFRKKDREKEKEEKAYNKDHPGNEIPVTKK
jgi:phospholipid/cholesterol/gamma-HCH transport system substrate-binding protein